MQRRTIRSKKEEKKKVAVEKMLEYADEEENAFSMKMRKDAGMLGRK